MKKDFWRWFNKPRFSWLNLLIILAIASAVGDIPSRDQKWATAITWPVLALLITFGVIRYRRKTTTKGTS